jgi:hypothetical protein
MEGAVIAAIELHRLVRVSFWDAMILHALVWRVPKSSTVKTSRAGRSLAACALSIHLKIAPDHSRGNMTFSNSSSCLGRHS